MRYDRDGMDADVRRKRDMKIKNILLSLRDQLPPSRFYRNFFVNRNGWGLFSIYAHINRRSGKPKVAYNTKEQAGKAAEHLKERYGGSLSAYKCMFCDGFHIGHDRSVNASRKGKSGKVPHK